MSNLVFVSGDFCSGSTLIFTLFRKSQQYYCLYEPLHEQISQHILTRPDPHPSAHHFFATDVFAELASFALIPDLYDRRWAKSELYLGRDQEAAHLYRYMNYVIGAAFRRAPRVMFKENRLSFRLGWIRARFPNAKIVHVYRDAQSQWRSNVRRCQEYQGREDVGQDAVGYNGFDLATYCEELRSTFPELGAKRFRTGFDRFQELWRLSYREGQKYSDVSVDYHDLTHEFETTWSKVWHSIGAPPIDVARLKRYVVPPERQAEVLGRDSGIASNLRIILSRWRARYSRARSRIGRVLRAVRGGSIGPFQAIRR